MRKVGIFGLLGGIGSQFIRRVAAISMAVPGLLAVATITTNDTAVAAARDATPILARNIDMKRGRANKSPHTESDQPLINGWPLYRTDRGQSAFNHAMATLKATDVAAPAAAAFKGCKNLMCKLSLPAIGASGWIPQGRIWVSPSQYVLFVHSPRRSRGRSYRRRGSRSMKYFVYHEFQNSTRNTDPYDTISAHKGSVFVPLYMGKQGTDARGNRYVVIVQVAPYDVRSVHASNKGSAGPGIEVAKNNGQKLQHLQGLAGILVGTIIKNKSPRLRVVHHRGREGRPMLDVYKRRLAALRNGSRGPTVTLPFVPAQAGRVARVSGALGEMITRRGVRRRTLVAARSAPRTNNTRKRTQVANRQARPVHSGRRSRPTNTARRSRPTNTARRSRPTNTARRSRPIETAGRRSRPIETAGRRSRPNKKVNNALSRLAVYLKANIATMKRHPSFASIIPQTVAHVGEMPRDKGTVYLLNSGQQVLGRVVSYRERGVTLKGVYVYMPANEAIDSGSPFSLDLTRPISLRLASLSPGPAASLMSNLVADGRPVTHQLIEPTRRATLPPAIDHRLVSR